MTLLLSNKQANSNPAISKTKVIKIIIETKANNFKNKVKQNSLSLEAGKILIQ